MDETGHTYWAVQDVEHGKWVCFAVDSDAPTPEQHWPHLPEDAEHYQVDRFSQCVDETYDGKSGWAKCPNLVREALIQEAKVLRDQTILEEPDYAGCATVDEVMSAMLRHRAECHIKYNNRVAALKAATSYEELSRASS